MSCERLRTPWRIWLVLGTICALAASAGCDGSVSVRGAVRTVNSEPISGAKVLITIPRAPEWNLEVTSTVDGCFDAYKMVAPGRYRLPLEVSAPGFKPLRMEVKTLVENRLLITLRRESEIEASTAEPVETLSCEKQ